MHRFRVTMEDGYSEVVTAKTEELARVQCLHLRLLHGEIREAKKARIKKEGKDSPQRTDTTCHLKGLVERKDISHSESPTIISPEYSSLMEEEVEDKTAALVMSFGRDKAMLLCIEMLAEYSRFENKSRTAFWTSVMSEIGKFSN